MVVHPDSPPPRAARAVPVPLVLWGGAAVLLFAMVGLHLRAAARTNHVALAAAPKPVAFVRAEGARFRPSRTYVGTLLPWNAARVGPQYVSAYVGAVLVRPGSAVRRGDVLATLDCRGSSAEAKAIAARARAVEERQAAIAHESQRLGELAGGGFASANEAEQLRARSAAEAAEVEGLRATLAARSLQVDDCVLRAPFAGEVADRLADPGAYARPGTPIVSIIDRNTVRLAADAPESDFAVIAPGTPVSIRVLATGKDLAAAVSRRAPAADEATRTVHFEIDLPNADRALPVGTTATIAIGVGEPRPASAVPLNAATVRGERASLFVVAPGPDGGAIAKRVSARVLGEAAGVLYLDPALAPGSSVVVEGRALLDDGDAVAAKELGQGSPRGGDR